MSISWNTYWTNPATGHYERQATLYSAAEAADDGEWFSCAGVDNVLVLVDESDDASVTISGHNSATVPANSSDGFTIGSAITADGFTEIEAKDIPRWMKIHADTVTSGNVSVYVKIRGRGLGNSSE